MEALLATAVAYLAIGWDVARRVDASRYGADVPSQASLAILVFASALLWPYEYWRLLKEDGNDRALD